MFYFSGLHFHLARNPHYMKEFAYAANNQISGYQPPDFQESDRSHPASRSCSPESFDRCFTRPSTFFIQIYICLAFVFSPAFPNSSLRFAKSFQTLCFSMATSPKETAASGSPAVPSSPHQEQPEFNIQPIQIIPGQASVPEKLVPRRQQGVKIAENPSLATSPREVDTEMDKKIRSIVSSILKDASVPDAEKDVPTSSTPDRSTEEDDQAEEETPTPRAPEPAPGDLIDLEEVESDEEPIANRLAPGIAERLQSRKGKTPLKRSGRIKTMAQKKSTPITPATSRRSKVAIPSKKRKEISSSDSDDDVELDVSTSKRAKKSGRKVPENVPDAPLDNISFHSIGNVEKWKYVYQRRLALERELGRAAMDCKEIMDLIKAAGLLKTVSKLGDCYEGLVREFIVNIPSDITNRKSDEYQKVFVRGKCVRFSPAVINKYLGRPTEGVVDIDVSEHQIAKEITAKRVQHWPKKGKLSAGKLSVKYAILHRIGAANWVPTNHTSTVATGLGKFLYAVGTKSKFNFGNYIFDQTVKHSESFAVKLPIAFPTVLCGIMLSQHPNILNYTDSVMKRESPLSLHYKLFEGTHVPDIVSTSGKAAASGAVSKDALIAELKDTCKALEATIKATTEKKMELELLIERLTDSGIDDGEAAENFNNKLRTTLLQNERRHVENFLQLIKNAWSQKGVSIVSDGWSDPQRRSLINFMVVTESGPMFLKAIDCSNEIKDKDFIAKHMREVIMEVGHSNVVQIVTDNATVCKAEGLIIEAEFPSIYWTPCVVHTLNLALKNICAAKNTEKNNVAYEECSWITQIADDAMFVKNFVMSHSMRLSIFNSFNSLKLLSISPTRFASTIVMLKRFKQLKKGLQEMVISDQWSSYKEDDVAMLDDKWWDKVDYILSFTSLIYDVLRRTDTEASSLHLVYEMWDSMTEKVKNAIYQYERKEESEGSTFYEVVHSILIDRWTKSSTPLHCLAHSLNPRYYSHEWLSEDSNQVPPHQDMELTRERLKCFKRFFLDVDVRRKVNIEFANFSDGREGFDDLDSLNDKGQMDPKAWWLVYGINAPILQKIALKLLVQPCSSSCYERNWSTYSFIHSLKRNKMAPHRVEELVFVHSNLQLLSRNTP
ncbi:hypothetical protein GmHk_18G052779 [Glycine max]|nr:hypothetical protein GmHk_18G052779 [Glycine max]